MATLTMSMAPWISGGGGIATLRPSAPMTLLSGSSVRTTGISLRSSTSRPALLSCSFIPISSSLSSSFAVKSSLLQTPNYIGDLLTQKNYIKEETIERMRLDEEVLMDFFREYISVSKVEGRVRTMSDLRELASAESLDTFTLVYTNILEHQPDCPSEVVDKLVSMREGIPKKDAKEVTNSYIGEELPYEERQALLKKDS